MIDMNMQAANRMAALANQALYDNRLMPEDADVFPHLRHSQLRELYAELVLRVFNTAKQHAEIPEILDLGAGEGSATLPFLELGAHVTAVDISENQLAALVKKCCRVADRLEVCHEEISETLRRKGRSYDVVVMNSCLHHIPDYLQIIEEATWVLRSHGQFFSFQDPLRYDTLGLGTLISSNLAYFFWRALQGNYIRGLKTRIRRVRGIYVSGSEEDDAEYHVTRNGVDQNAIVELFQCNALTCEVISYFSTQSWFFQIIGTYLGLENTFAVIARKT
jgi:SAM-dependent methyltransferase